MSPAVGMPYAEVIGDPIAHSKSPLVHKFWLEKLGIEGDYRACLVRPHELADYFAARRRDEDWLGCNVTMPHKAAVIPFLKESENKAPEAPLNRVASVNTIAPRGGYLEGGTTDIAGFLESMLPYASELAGKRAILIGAGGAARCVLFSLMISPFTAIDIFCRSLEKGRHMVEQVHPDPIPCSVRPLSDPLSEAGLLVNATPLGMVGQPPLVADLSPLPADAIVFDLVYAPVETPLIEAARARGLRVIDGITMLIAQAGQSFAIFFNRPPPRQYDVELRELLTR